MKILDFVPTEDILASLFVGAESLGSKTINKLNIEVPTGCPSLFVGRSPTGLCFAKCMVVFDHDIYNTGDEFWSAKFDVSTSIRPAIINPILHKLNVIKML